jgi:secreted trypsin-like serine protease
MKRSTTALAALACSLLLALGLLPAGHADDDGPSARPRIVGGTAAAQGEFPWMVHYDYHGQWTCGGAFLRADLILTAAHCLEGSGADTDIVVEYGDVRLGSGNTIRSTEVYDRGDTGTDWGLIKLESKVPGATLLPIVGNTSYDRGTFTVMGWGRTSEGGSGSDRLLKVNVPFISDSTCAAYGGLYDDLNPATELCAGYDAGGKDSCQGDSGGPMVKKLAGGTFVQAGIVSWGDGCARADAPGVYTQVSHFASAIYAKATEMAGPPASCSRTNQTDVRIRDLATVGSWIRTTTCAGRTSATSKISVNIRHTKVSNLVVSLVAPDGTVYKLHNRQRGAHNLVKTYTRNLSGEVRNGIWKLRVRDAVSGNVGKLDGWRLTL